MTTQPVATRRRAEDGTFTFVDLFAGIGGFHAALSALGGNCVYVSEIDEAASAVYQANWGDDIYAYDPDVPVMRGDINEDAPQRDAATGRTDGVVRVPPHDVLVAGFPCQAFSKSGAQLGVLDKTRGTLFYNIVRILQERCPKIVFLENVRNLAGPRHRDTWKTIIDALEEIGYEVAREPMVVSPHLIAPADGGTPQVRDRVYILAIYKGKDHRAPADEVEPTFTRETLVANAPTWDLASTAIPWLDNRPILQPDEEIDRIERYRLTSAEVEWIDAWDEFVVRMRRAGVPIPGHPIWSEWFKLASQVDWAEVDEMPAWKQNFVRKNVEFYQRNRKLIEDWRACAKMAGFDNFPPSRRKFEWQAQDTASLWDCLMHLRPSGIRAKRPTYVPALVAITQTTIVGPRRRRLTPVEGARLQGLDDTFTFAGQAESQTYKQLGNGVCAGAVHYTLRAFVKRYRAELERHLPGLVAAVDAAEVTGWKPPRGGSDAVVPVAVHDDQRSSAHSS